MIEQVIWKRWMAEHWGELLKKMEEYNYVFELPDEICDIKTKIDYVTYLTIMNMNYDDDNIKHIATEILKIFEKDYEEAKKKIEC